MSFRTLRSQRDKEELLRRLDGITPSSIRQWGTMSAHQMICHLCDGYRMYLGEKQVAPVKVPSPRILLRWLALWTPIPWPKGYKTAPELDQQAGGGTPPAQFELDMERLRALIERCASVPADFAWPGQHPHFGAMSERDWKRLGYLHCDHHLRQFGA